MYKPLIIFIFSFGVFHNPHMNDTSQKSSSLISVNKNSAGRILTRYLTEKQWNELFPHRYDGTGSQAGINKAKRKDDFYSYTAMVAAASRFPVFMDAKDELSQKRELCAFLANVALETGGGWDGAPGGYYKWGLYFKEERGCEKGCLAYSDTSKKKYPPVITQSYHGRGPLQLSWNYNYGQFSEAWFGNKDILLQNPSRLSQDPVISFASAFWFWTTPQAPKPSCHDIMCNKWIPSAKDSLGRRLPGFGSVVNVINGGIECGTSQSKNAKYRYGYYLYFCNYFHITPGSNTECSTQRPFGQ